MDKSLELAAKLFEHSMGITHNMVNSSLEYFQKRSEELETLCSMYMDYINYVDKCIQLQTVPRPFYFWKQYIL